MTDSGFVQGGRVPSACAPGRGRRAGARCRGPEATSLGPGAASTTRVALAAPESGPATTEAGNRKVDRHVSFVRPVNAEDRTALTGVTF